MGDLDEIRRLLEKKELTIARQDLDDIGDQDDEKAQAEKVVVGVPDSEVQQRDGMLVLAPGKFENLINAFGKDVSSQIKEGDALPLLPGESVTVDTRTSVAIPEGAFAVVSLLPEFVGNSGLILTNGGIVGCTETAVKLTITNVKKDTAIIMKSAPMATIAFVDRREYEIKKFLK